MPYVGDYNLTTTFHHRFTTVNGSGVPTTLGNTPSAQYYVDGGTTAFTAGLTLTADFNSVTGLNSLAVICTSSATGLTSGINVSVQLAAGTVSAVSLVGYPIIEYSITRRSPLRPATANRTVLISSTGYAAIDWAAIGTPGATNSLSATTLFTTTNVTNDVGAIVTAVNTITPARITAQGIDVGAIVTVSNTVVNANVTSIQGGVTAATNLEIAFDDTAGAVRHLGIIDQGAAQSATSTTLVLRSGAAFENDTIVGSTIIITAATSGVGQCRSITDYDLATDTATVDAWNVTPTGTINYKVFGSAPASSTSLPPVSVAAYTTAIAATVTAVSTIVPARVTAQGIDIGAIVTAVSTIVPARVTAQGIDVGAIVTAVSTIVPARVTAQGIDVGAIVTTFNTIAAARVTVVSASGLASYFLTNSGTTYAAATAGSVVKETADNAGGTTLTATAVASAVWDKDATGHQTQGTFGQTIGDSVADSTTLYAAVTSIKSKVTALTFTSANRVDANIKAVADVTVTGFGTTANTWGP